MAKVPCISKKTSKLRVTGLCAETGEFPAQMARNAEIVSIWCRYHVYVNGIATPVETVEITRDKLMR